MAGSSRRVDARAMAGGRVRRWLGLPPRSAKFLRLLPYATSVKLFGTRPIVGALALVVMLPVLPSHATAENLPAAPVVPERTGALESQQTTAIVTGWSWTRRAAP
jgi:hypothetical protein